MALLASQARIQVMHDHVPLVWRGFQFNVCHATDKAAVLGTERSLVDVQVLDCVNGHVNRIGPGDRVDGLCGIQQKHALAFRDSLDEELAALNLENPGRDRKFLFEFLLDDWNGEQLLGLQSLCCRTGALG